MDWIDLARDSDQWMALVNTVMNLRVPQNGKFLSIRATGGLSRTTHLYGVTKLFHNIPCFKQVGSGDNTSDLYSEHIRFESRLWSGPSWIRIFVNLLNPPGECWDSTLKQASTVSFRIRSNSTFINKSYHSTIYILGIKSVVKQTARKLGASDHRALRETFGYKRKDGKN
jgi:hypothetical protein